MNNRLSRSDGGVGCLTAFRLFVCEWVILEGGCDLGLLLRDGTADLGGMVTSGLRVFHFSLLPSSSSFVLQVCPNLDPNRPNMHYSSYVQGTQMKRFRGVLLSTISFAQP